jgi:D-tagatose-1,6-bisphosphate aldolase subunit GatZ/KbaZ
MGNQSRDRFLNILEQNKGGKKTGIYSICSANKTVLQACLLQAREDHSILLVESTSNQVDQYGGYTGMKPEDFMAYVNSLARAADFPVENVLFGGDHLGPYQWRALPAAEAMARSKKLIEAYVKAGFQKIHIDTSMLCADDAADMEQNQRDELIAGRTAELCMVAENTWETLGDKSPRPLYVIGSEVPLPGGAQQKEEGITPTEIPDLDRTISNARESFRKSGLGEALSRVIAVVVQPGVEFGDDSIHPYQRKAAEKLSRRILDYEGMVYEAHSTDYQSEASLRALVEDHFCILKVGPWLTFAYREGLFALEHMEKELLGNHAGRLSGLGDTLESVMRADPGYWEPYYTGSAEEQALKRKFSFSDRARYYWPSPALIQAGKQLFMNLRENRIPLSLLSQYMPDQYMEVAANTLENDPEALLVHKIRSVAGIYSRACGISGAR